MLDHVKRHAEAYLASLPERPVAPPVEPSVLRERLAVPLGDDGVPAEQVIDELVAGVEPGLVASAGPRYFGFVTGQALPAARAADQLAAVWDQNAFSYVSSPAAAVVEEVAQGWLLDVLHLPDSASVGFVTGAQMANATCLAVARDAMREHGPIKVIAGEEAHATIFSALRFIGLEPPELRPVDDQGALQKLELDGPAIVCAQAGNVNSGAFDNFQAIARECREHGAWLHIDGAFGLWAAASSRRHLTTGIEHADSWAADAHKWLNVPYDSGLAIVSDPEAHRAAMSLQAAYLIESEHRQNYDFTPEASRRARGFAVYAALRSLGRTGLRDLVDRCCDHAVHMAELLRQGGAEILNEVNLNQVLVACEPEAVTRIQRDGTCWAGGTTWHGRHALRISISGYETSTEDIERSAKAILANL
jgi:glutamate/tyrosine decarboxylase-like PLP-dependent enzyme